MLLDCGLMFPDARHARASTSSCPTSPTCARTPTASMGCIATHGHEDHVGGLSFLLRELSFPIYGSALTLGLARNRIEEAGLLDRTELIAVADGERRKIGPFDVRVHPRHPLGAPRLRHRVPHPAGHDPAHRRLQARPHPGRRPPHRPGPHGRHRPRTRASACCCRDSTNADEHGHSRSETLGRRGALRPVPRARGPAHHHRLLRQPHPPGAADRRRRHRLRPRRRHPRPVDEEERAPGPRDGRCCTSPSRRCVDIEDIDDLPAGQGLRDLHRLAGRADVGAGPAWPPARTAGSSSAPTTS